MIDSTDDDVVRDVVDKVMSIKQLAYMVLVYFKSCVSALDKAFVSIQSPVRRKGCDRSGLRSQLKLKVTVFKVNFAEYSTLVVFFQSFVDCWYGMVNPSYSRVWETHIDH